MPVGRIILAPDSFKGTLAAPEVAAAMERGVRRAVEDRVGRAVRRGDDGHPADLACEIIPMPVGDGGEGTLDILLRHAATHEPRAEGAKTAPVTHRERVTGPLGRPVDAPWVILPDGCGFIELAKAAGLMLVDEDARDPMRATTYGVGEMIRSAMRSGCTRLIVGVGGSATVDGGTGIAQALGYRFIHRTGRQITRPMCGELLSEIARIEPPPEGRPAINLEVACDVTNPLLGPHGAAAVYAPQKGANAQQVERLERGLAHLAAIAGGDPHAVHAGAAGGAAYGLATFLDGTLRSGIDLVLDLLRFDDALPGAHLVLTGEGRLDSQSRFGKAAMGVAARAARAGVPTIAIVGATGPGWESCLASGAGDGRLAEVISLSNRYGGPAAVSRTAESIEQAAREAIGVHRRDLLP